MREIQMNLFTVVKSIAALERKQAESSNSSIAFKPRGKLLIEQRLDVF
jgi:hypothetical protein